MDTQALEARSELVDLNALVRPTERGLSALAGDRIAVATALEPRFSPITADPRELKQALLNLVLNARDAMPDGGKITIETANVVLDETTPRTTASCPRVTTPSWRSRTPG